MPTAPIPHTLNRRNVQMHKEKNQDDNQNFELHKDNSKTNSDVDVAQIHLEWACPASPCNKKFWWATKPKPIKKRGSDNQIHK